MIVFRKSKITAPCILVNMREVLGLKAGKPLESCHCDPEKKKDGGGELKQ